MLRPSLLSRSLLAAGLAGAALAVSQPACAAGSESGTAPRRPAESRPVAWEVNWTQLKSADGAPIGMLGAGALVAVNDDWGLGPTIYGAARGDFGGLFVFGMTGQRRWRLGPNTHLAASFFAGGGGGRSSESVHFGSGLMIRPELSVRTEFGRWYAGAGISHLRFPSGNLSGSQVSLSFGRMGLFDGFDVAGHGVQGEISTRSGLGFDEVSLSSAVYRPADSQRTRSGRSMGRNTAVIGADLRQYFAPGAWLGLEASGAAKGGIDGYMEVLGTAGQDWEIGRSGLRVGGQLAMGLAGGGDVSTGSGWVWRAGPSIRWQSPWGPAVRIELGKLWSRGTFTAPYLRASLSLPLEPLKRREAPEALLGGEVHEQAMYATLQRIPHVAFKDGSQEGVTQQGLLLVRSLGAHAYGAAAAGAAVQGKAGAYAYGLFGLGLRSDPLWGSRWRVGGEMMLGAGGGGGVGLGGGALRQSEAWLQWQGQEDYKPLRVRVGVGRWQDLRGRGASSSQLNLALGYAWGTL